MTSHQNPTTNPTTDPSTTGNPIISAGADRVSSHLFSRQILFRLAIIRNDLGISQEGLAKNSGVSRRTICKAERGRFISFESAKKIAKSFGLPLKMFWESHEGERKWNVKTNCKAPQAMRVVPNLRERRKKKGWVSQDAFAGMIEIGRSVLVKAEQGKPVKVGIADRIEEALK